MPDPLASDGDGRDPLTALAHAAHDVSAPFACDGELEAGGTPSVRFASGVRVPLDPRDWGLAGALKRHCVPVTASGGASPHRWRLDAAGGAFRVEGFDPASSGVLEAVRASLFPDEPGALRAELHALELDEPGGVSLHRRDTPAGDALGSLVAWAPSGYTGGELVVALRGLERRFQWMFHRGATRAAIPWVASFGPVDQAVEAVASGALVTLTWALHRAGDAPAGRLSAERHGDRFTAALAAALCDPMFLPGGASLGFSCAHAYGDATGLARSAEGLTDRSALKLEGRDRVIAEAALGLGLDVRLVPYALDDVTGEHWRLARCLDAGERKRFLRPCEAPADGSDDMTWVIAPRADGIEQMTSKRPPAQRLGAAEADHGALYQRAVVAVRMPPYEARRAEVAARVRAPPAAETPAEANAPAAPKATPKEEVTAGQLRALGYSPAEVKRLVGDGTLEKTGFGWYRFLRAPA